MRETHIYLTFLPRIRFVEKLMALIAKGNYDRQRNSNTKGRNYRVDDQCFKTTPPPHLHEIIIFHNVKDRMLSFGTCDVYISINHP